MRYMSTNHSLFGKRQYDEALVECQKALAIYQEILVENHEGTGACFYGIGIALHGKRQYEEALVELRKCLAIYREAIGEDHPDTANCYEVIGNIYSVRGKPDDSFIGYGKALTISFTAVWRKSHTHCKQLL